MKIDYCPKCDKAGLKHNDPEGKNANGHTRQQRYEVYMNIRGNEIPLIPYGSMKWCPRCKEWVKPENRPYIGSRLSG